MSPNRKHPLFMISTYSTVNIILLNIRYMQTVINY